MLAVNITTTDKSRVFIAPYGADAINTFEYYNSMVLGGISKQYSDSEAATIPHPTLSRQFITVDKVVTANPSKWSTSLIGRLLLKKQSVLKELADAENDFDVQCHFGLCNDPTDFNEYDLAVVLENAHITDYSTDAMGTLDQTGVAVINETTTLTAEKVFYVYNRPYSLIEHDVLDGCIVAIAVQEPFDGHKFKNLYGLQIPSNLSGTDIDIIYSSDGGVNWKRTVLFANADVENTSLTNYHIAVDNLYCYVLLTDNVGFGHLLRIKLEDIKNGNGGVYNYRELSGVRIDAILHDGKTIIAVGLGGLIEKIDCNTLTHTIIPSGSIAPNFHAISGSAEHFIAGGQAGGLIEHTITNGSKRIYITINESVANATIISLCMKSEKEWLVGTDLGILYATNDGGITWKEITTFASCISSIKFVSRNIGYLTTRHDAKVYRTIDGGSTWVELNTTSDITVGATVFGLLVMPNDPSNYLAYGTTTMLDNFDSQCNDANLITPVIGTTGLVFKPQN